MISTKSSWSYIKFVAGMTLSICLATSTAAAALNFTQFVDCIGPNTGGYGSTCQLAANPGTPYPIASTLVVTRNNILVEGTIVISVTDTTLQRTSALGYAPILQVGTASSNVSGVGVANLTIDGNRGGLSGLTCFDWASAPTSRLM